MKRILFVDDHAIIRQGVINKLKDILDTPADFDEASNGQQAIKMAVSCKYDLILLDISLPDLHGLDVLKLILQQQPKVPIIILSSYPEDHYAVRTIRAGAFGYVNKGCDSSILKDAIEMVLSGKKYVSLHQASLLADAICENNPYSSLHGTLSDREHQLACMMTTGMTQTEIARGLNLSVKTVSTYRTRILEKLHLRTTADIINYCINNNLTM